MKIRFGGALKESNQPCTMRDGIVLYADIYRPDDDRLYPVLLMRQPYGRTLASTVTQAHPVWYVRQGFIVVIQDVRGRGDSGGAFDPFIHEADDGYDAVEWAAGLPGSNGCVGMYGFSYQGFTQWAAASVSPPSLKAIAPGMCGADLYRGMFYPQGRFAVFEHVPWGFQLARDSARRVGGEAAIEAYTTRIRRKTPDEHLYPLPEDGSHPILKGYFPQYEEWYSHSTYDAYWESRNWMNALRERSVPTFLIGGWYDVFLMGTLLDYEALRGRERAGNGVLRLMIGPWDHIPWGRYAGGRDHGPEADGRIHEQQAAWFRYWLKGPEERSIESPLLADAEVTYFERGSAAWRSIPSASPFTDGARRLRYELQGGERPSNGALGSGRLKEMAASGSGTEAKDDIREKEANGCDVFVYDARMPMVVESYQPIDRSAQQDRNEILVYTSSPANKKFRIFGKPSVKAQYQLIGGPTDLVAILSLVRPDGSAEFLTAGRTEISEEAGESGSWGQATVELRPLAFELAEGEVIRLELTGSAYPLFAIHPNGCPPDVLHEAEADVLKMATVAIGYGTEGGSWLQLPLIDDEGGQ
ncbi:CocE/NonD family hydrolase [Paenibacillus sp. OV219]|uniref:CocE/NonD family hydrolase n=1 Tax=Paenibacillus sp. OV219 TaxID=1884377 RepID=UPI0008ABBA34|nr:CocE/NonD family hydrolase [Paenibacillus sp. OV219]SEO76508.1 hypothetical protein SAMN05518847_110175 [Paenibacillus sp. OV219]